MRTLSEPPLPTISQLMAAIGSKEADAEPWVRKHPTYSAHWFASGSEALAAAVCVIGKSSGFAKPVVWLPAYFCNYALRFLRSLDVEVRFYDIESDLSIDWRSVEKRVRNSAGIFVLVHYFGFPAQTSEAMEFCSSNGCALIEDAAHVMVDASDIGQAGALVFSPHKLLPTPDGGLLMMNSDLSSMMPGRVAPHASLANWSWTGKRLAQRALSSAHVPWHRLKGYSQVETTPSSASREASFAECGHFARKLIAVLQEDIESIVTTRRANYLRLLGAFQRSEFVRPLRPLANDGVCPYVFPAAIVHETSSCIKFLRSNAVPASPWPDLPPEVTDSPELFPNSIELGRRTLLLPVHQTLTSKQIDHMVTLLTEYGKKP